MMIPIQQTKKSPLCSCLAAMDRRDLQGLSGNLYYPCKQGTYNTIAPFILKDSRGG